MREQVVRQAVDKGLRLAKTRTRLTTNLASPSLSPARPSVSAAGGLQCVPSVCPHQNLHPQRSPPASSSSSSSLLSASQVSQGTRVFGQTNSASSSATVTASQAFPGALQTPAAATTAASPATTAAINVETPSVARVRNFEEMPGPKGYPIVGTLLEYFRKENRGRMHEIQRRNHRMYGNIFMEPFGPAKNVCVADPSIVEEILRSEGPHPNRPPYESWVLYNNLRKRRGGIMTSQGEYWKASRRTMHGKLMKPEAAGRFIEGLNATTAEFIARIGQLKEDRDSVQQLPFEINKFTMEAVGRMLLNVRIGTLDPAISPKIKQFIEAIGTMFLTGHQLMAFARVHQILRTKVWEKHVEAWDTIYALSNELIAVQVDEARRRLEENGHLPRDNQDLISHMVSAGTLTREEIIDNLTETFMGGVDTVANGVSFMLYLLAVNESAQSKLRAEVDSVLGQRSCTQEDLHDMPYVKAVVKETLRLYPPIPLNARVTQEEQVIANYRIPKGTIIMLNNYTMSRDERIFAEPDSFLPDRWLRAEVASWHPFSAIPFGYGVRSCVGRRLSENLMYVAAIQMVQHFILRKDPSFDITPLVRTQFTPGPELPVLFQDR